MSGVTDRPAFLQLKGSTVSVAQVAGLRFLGAETPDGTRLLLWDTDQLPDEMERDAALYLVAQLLAWLWSAHNLDTVQLAHRVVAKLVAWRDGELKPEQMAQLLHALGIVRSLNPADVPAGVE